MASTSGRRVVVPLTNKSGGSVAAGDVVIIDTANNEAFTTTTTGAYTGLVGIAQETIANNATGRVATSGYVPLVNVNASVTRGNYGKTYTVAKQGTDAGASRVVGAFCQFLTGGTTPTATLFGFTDSTGGGGAVATDAIWDAAGDLAVGTGADTAAKLTKGSAGAMLAMGNGSVIWNAGTSFPGSKATNDRYWRTDIAGGMGFHWDGTNWVSDTLYQVPITGEEALLPASASFVSGHWAHPGNALGLDIWLIDLETTFLVSGGTALGASHKWVGLFRKVDSSNTTTTVATINIDSGSSSVWRKDAQAVGASFDDATYYSFDVSWTKTGTPGTLRPLSVLSYRLIAT